MSLFVIDEKKCKQDGICASVCPLSIIISKKDEYPSPAKKAGDLCIGCGHCAAVCPHGAFNNNNIEPAEYPEIQKELLLSPEQIEHYLRYRRSTRAYKNKSVDRETIQKVLDTAAYAPSGHNAQEVYWTVISGENNIHKLVEGAVEWMRSLLEGNARFEGSDILKHCVNSWEHGKDMVCRSAPHVIVAHSPEMNPTGALDCAIALTHLDIIAPSFGLGTCWAGILNMAESSWPQMKKVLTVPEGHKFHAGMMLGYPKHRYHRLPPRNRAKIIWG